MSRLPRISGRQVIKALRKAGYEFDYQGGSHIVLRHTAPPHRRLTVRDHEEVGKFPEAAPPEEVEQRPLPVRSPPDLGGPVKGPWVLAP